MNYMCQAYCDKNREPSIWEASLEVLKKRGTTLELRFTGRGSSIHAIVGPQINGKFICIPNYDVGSELAGYQDTFWNRERLTPLIGVVDATTVANGLACLISNEA